MSRIVYCYGVEAESAQQERYLNELRSSFDRLEVEKGLPMELGVIDSEADNSHTLVVLDDLRRRSQNT